MNENRQTRATTSSPKRRRPIRWIALLGLGMLFGSLTLQAQADPTIYFYSSGGPVDVTASYFYQQHYLYSVSNTLVGTVDDAGIIYDLYGAPIGYIAGLPPHDPG